MQELFRPLHAEISLGHVRHNFKTLKKMAGPGAFFCPMIKANAYGHGDIGIAKALVNEGAEHFGVASIEEAIGLRAANVKTDILVFHPLLNEAAARAMWQYELTPVVSNLLTLQLLEKTAPAKQKISVHVKFNTGMSRLGFATSDAATLKTFFASTRQIQLAGICTHLLSGEDALLSGGRSHGQFNQFAELCKIFSDPDCVGHILNSSGILAQALSKQPRPLGLPNQKWGVRPGISLYGIHPDLNLNTLAEKEALAAVDLRPVMRVVAKIVHLQKLASGETVSYGGRFQARRESTIGVVPIGYADGYMRRLTNQSRMLCRGQVVPVTGTVCMDFTMIDVTDLQAKEKLQVGEEVVVLGEQQVNGSNEKVSALELAQLVGTNTYEILTSVSSRVPRVFND